MRLEDGSTDTGWITPEQCRAARGWLGWSQGHLAHEARVAISTVRDFESGKREPVRQNRYAISAAFRAVGVDAVFDVEMGLPIGLLFTAPALP